MKNSKEQEAGYNNKVEADAEKKIFIVQLLVALAVIILLGIGWAQWRSFYEPWDNARKRAAFEQEKKECLASLTDDEVRFEWKSAQKKFDENARAKESQRLKIDTEKQEQENLILQKCADPAYRLRNESECNRRGGLYYEDNSGYDYTVRTVEDIFQSNILVICDRRKVDSSVKTR